MSFGMSLGNSAPLRLYAAFERACARIPWWPVALALRLVIAHPFFVSGQTKVDGPHYGGVWQGIDFTFKLPTGLRDGIVDLFASEYKLPLLPPALAAYLSAFMEHALPALIVLGLATRLSALGLLVMTMVIQIFVYPDAWWTVHSYWAVILAALIAKGAGAVSLDRLLGRA